MALTRQLTWHKNSQKYVEVEDTMNQWCVEYCYCIGYLINPPAPDSVRRYLLDEPHIFHCIEYFVLGGICTYLEVSRDSINIPVDFSNSCPLNLLLV